MCGIICGGHRTVSSYQLFFCEYIVCLSLVYFTKKAMALLEWFGPVVLLLATLAVKGLFGCSRCGFISVSFISSYGQFHDHKRIPHRNHVVTWQLQVAVHGMLKNKPPTRLVLSSEGSVFSAFIMYVRNPYCKKHYFTKCKQQIKSVQVLIVHTTV